MNAVAAWGRPLVCLFLCAGLAGPALADVEITDGWARETVPGATTGAGYLVMHNAGSQPRKLTGMSSPAAAQVTAHQSSVDAQGVARMLPVTSLELAPEQTLRFDPSGYHLMFEGLKAPLKVGGEVPVTFQFSGEKPLTVRLKVRSLMDAGDAAPAHEHEHAHHH
ncbi:MAG: copper chaperone PCu(A)C [Steroidobacteraceae bacterium]